MKMIKFSHKIDFGVKITFYSLKEFVKFEFDEKISSAKFFMHFDTIEGKVENFEMEKWQRFVNSEDPKLFEIYVN